MLDLAHLAPLAAIGLMVGVFIGCIGIGGVLLVPSLTYIGGMEVHLAIASCMFSYIFSGIVGGIEFARRGSIRWSMAGWLCAGAMPGAFAGAYAVSLVPGFTLELLIASLIVGSGLHALGTAADGDAEGGAIQGPNLTAIGTVTGVGSAMSGTGGPLILVPALVWLRVPVLTAVGLSQVVQLPVALLATAGNFRFGQVDVQVGIGIAVLLMIGVTLGARLAHYLPARTLKRAVAVVLLAVGAMILVRVAHGALGA